MRGRNHAAAHTDSRDSIRSTWRGVRRAVTRDKAESIFLLHVAAIERLTACACRRSRMAGDEIDDLKSHVKLALIQGDYAIIRKFEGRSSFTTFLTTVIRRLISQHRIKERGRWRPSAKAKRLGQLAIEAERSLTREGQTVHEAAQLLAGQYPGRLSSEILELINQLPQRRVRPRHVPAPDAARAGIQPDDPLQDLLNRELSLRAARALHLVQSAIAALPAVDQRILRQRFFCEQNVRVIADSVRIRPRDAYKRLYASLSRLRASLEEKGFTRREILDLTGQVRHAIDDLVEPVGLNPSGGAGSARVWDHPCSSARTPLSAPPWIPDSTPCCSTAHLAGQ